MEQFELHPFATNPLMDIPREWIEIEPNIHQMTVNENTASGRKTVLQRWQPKTHNVQQNFVHDDVEEICIVEGDLADTKRGGKWTKGAYAYRKPGMEHGPFYSEKGCLMFIVVIPK